MPNSTMNTVTLSGTSGQGISLNSSLGSSQFAWSNLTSSFETYNPKVKKYEVVESQEDLLALAVTAHRMMKEKKIHYKLLDNDLFEKIEPNDRSLAQEIRDYYSKKVMMLKLKSERQMSKFREDMNKLIHSDGTTFKEDMIGIAYWLPKFYEYDTEVDEIKQMVTTNHLFEKLDKEGKPSTLNLTASLEPLKRVHRKSKRSKSLEYWFKDSKLNAAVVLRVEEKNQLQHLWDYLYNTEKVLQIKGYYTRKTLDGFEHFSITNWELDRG